MQTTLNQKPAYDVILQESRKILKEFSLCDSCLGRLYVKKLHLISAKLLGKKIKFQINYKKDEKCYICKNLLDHLDPYVERLLDISKNTAYSSFLVGAILKPSFMDRDDFIRSKFKTRGIDSVKTEITRHITKSFAKKSQKIPEPHDPDITFLVNFRIDTCKLRLKSLIVFGRYIKNTRGLPQKQKPCPDCSGRGCIFCNNCGIVKFNSIEGIIAQYFYKHYDCIQAKFTWIGGEDKDSLVSGSGRLFFAKLVNPKKRNSGVKKQIRLGPVTLFGLRKIGQIPTVPIRFQSTISIQVHANSKIKSLSRLKLLVKNPITISDGSKTTKRVIHFVSYAKTGPDSFTLNIVADGGVPIKKLVEGEGIEPNVSAILGVNCTCVQFDFSDISISNVDLD